MKSDVNGASTCPPGQERVEYYNMGTRCQYDYRTPEGALFSTVAKNVEEARAKRDAWLREQQEAKVQRILRELGF